MRKRRLKKIIIHIPAQFLEEFDRKIDGIYASRNEAIRAGMILILEDLKTKKEHSGEENEAVKFGSPHPET